LVNRSNPFATRYTRPGAVEFLFAAGMSAAGLVERLAQQQWWGAIVGPHGAGKSTLLQTLIPELERAGRRVILVRLLEAERRVPNEALAGDALDERTLVIVDGYEQLGWWQRWRLARRCRRRSAGLLVTAHGATGIAELWRVEPSLATTQAVVACLLGDEAEQIPSAVVADLYERHAGNVRETLFALFDHYQRQTRPADKQALPPQ
jgi:hypothetical protein